MDFLAWKMWTRRGLRVPLASAREWQEKSPSPLLSPDGVGPQALCFQKVGQGSGAHKGAKNTASLFLHPQWGSGRSLGMDELRSSLPGGHLALFGPGESPSAEHLRVL